MSGDSIVKDTNNAERLIKLPAIHRNEEAALTHMEKAPTLAAS